MQIFVFIVQVFVILLIQSVLVENDKELFSVNCYNMIIDFQAWTQLNVV